MAHLADLVHEKGLLFGMYSSAGEMTCARDGKLNSPHLGFPDITIVGSLDHEFEDAQIWAKWGVDYLKYDNCFNRGRFGTPLISFQRYEVMWNAINATGRPMLYSLCNWGEDSTHAVR
jgi:alpha-galactosidase